MDASAITAVLGPTNTGKTYRAIQRMLEHSSGMIGLPLRLLAREVYDVVSAKVGEEAVALVTGEEQRIPKRPAYWVATVEAMPVEREVDFLAVDEVQLAAHEQRGHVFTSRILSARGRKETWFLGAGSMRGVLSTLTPSARVEEHPRYSKLTFAKSGPLSKLPPRSAVVAFSMAHVYELAERIRIRHGGTAVVLGALSPRTRNAQVAMFQAGEVDYLVATDAIGMGLNLGVGHVAFAALRKFDGQGPRELDVAEIAQIAGRAGRWIENGTFGTVDPVELPASVVRDVEDHRVPSVRRVRWRNDRLDFESVTALRASLAVKAPRSILLPIAEADDARAFRLLATDPEVAAFAQGEERVRLLWEVCTVPDFRKLLFEAHVAALRELFLELVRAGTLGDDWMRAHVRGLDDESGDVEHLVARISATRVWTYVANRSSWIASSEAWADTTRRLEDRLSDMLHTRLVSRFVDVKKKHRTQASRPRAPARPSTPSLDEDRFSRGHPFAALAPLRNAMVDRESSTLLLPPRGGAWVDEVVDASHDRLRLQSDGCIIHIADSRVVGRLVAGPRLAMPDVRVVDDDEVGAGARRRIHRRLLAFARDLSRLWLADLPALAASAASPTLRALLFRLEESLGVERADALADVVSALNHAERVQVDGAGVVLGRTVVYSPRGLRPDAIEAKLAFIAVADGLPRPSALDLPRKGAVSLSVSRGVAPTRYAAIGYPVFAGRAIRADVVERVVAAGATTDASLIASWIGCKVREVPRILEALRPADLELAEGSGVSSVRT